jgi:prephenate dehydrogenase (NADP+)
LESFKSRYVYLTYEEHDLVTANTQAVTHAAFLSMGTAWKNSQDYPWETERYVGGIEIVKINIALRIYSNKWHVYAGLAILNPSAREQIRMYAQCATDIFKLMIEEKKDALRQRMYEARQGVFGWTQQQEGDVETSTASKQRKPILLSDRILDQFSLGPKPPVGEPVRPNSHLSLLAMVDCWHKLGIKPYDHLDVAGTPVFMLWIGECDAKRDTPWLMCCCRQASRNTCLGQPRDWKWPSIVLLATRRIGQMIPSLSLPREGGASAYRLEALTFTAIDSRRLPVSRCKGMASPMYLITVAFRLLRAPFSGGDSYRRQNDQDDLG